jgi:hypothetical protein
MNTNSKIVLAVVAGIALGAAAVQGLHAQAKPKAFFVSETKHSIPQPLPSMDPISELRSTLPVAKGSIPQEERL